MKPHKPLKFILALALLGASMSSCELANKLGGRKTPGQQAQRVEQIKSSQKGGKIKNEKVLPQDREQIAATRKMKEFTPEELKQGAVKGDWAIETVFGKKAVGSTSPFLKFVPETKSVYGNNGCNTINSEYSYNPQDSVLVFTNTVTTMMLCPDVEGITDGDITTALTLCRKYSWSQEDSRYYLHFYDSKGLELMTLMHQNFQFLNGTWDVIAINAEPVYVLDMKIVMDVDEEKVHGNTGCNTFNGRLAIDMDAPNSISFEQIAMTMRLCRDNEYETPFVVALEEVHYARPIAADKVLLLDSHGEAVLTLERAK